MKEKTDKYAQVMDVFNELLGLALRRAKDDPDRIDRPFPYKVRLVVDEETALAGRDPDGRGQAAAEVDEMGTGTVYIAPKLANETRPGCLREHHRERQVGVLAHELAHVSLLQRAHDIRHREVATARALSRAGKLENHTEREADAEAERLFGYTIRYDEEEVQTISPDGVAPRPAHLDREDGHTIENPTTARSLRYADGRKSARAAARSGQRPYPSPESRPPLEPRARAPIANPPLHMSFVLEEHREYGEKGWRPKNQPTFDPLSGMTVAHDILEHFADSSDSADDEFQALGAALFVRGLGGYWQHSWSSPGANVGSDLVSIMRHIVENETTFHEPPNTSRLGKDEDQVEGWIVEALVDALNELKAETGGEPEFMREANALKTKVAGWLRVGFRRAVKRYAKFGKRGGALQATAMFREIEQKADHALKVGEIGDELQVEASIERGTVSVRHLTAEDLFPDEYGDDL